MANIMPELRSKRDYTTANYPSRKEVVFLQFNIKGGDETDR
jgi:hypothetical protein